MACYGLGRPSTACLATRREARPRCVPTDFCFPLLRLRVPAPHRFPASLRSLRFAHRRWACTHGEETGGPGVSRRLIRFSGLPGLVRGVLLPRTPGRAEPLTPLSPPLSVFAALSHERDFLGPPRPCRRPLREDEVSYFDPRCLPSLGVARAPARAGHRFQKRSRDGFPPRLGPRRPFARGRCAALLAPAFCRGLDPRPRTLSRSGEVESARFSGSDAAYRLLQQTIDARAHPSSVRSSPALNARPF
jgi:hypothetical protein